tara:strand:- start:1143 stop:1460 length:318 start_codon:yes stop_codon:yes gene_type:complete
MKKIRLKESELITLIEKTINEQGSSFDWESSLDGWDIQRDAREEGRYCEDYPDNYIGPRYFEGQYCNVETNWYDWESSPGVKTTGQGSSGKWQCGVGCMVSLKEG